MVHRGKTTACLVGIRADESLNRFRTLIIDKTRFEGRQWTTWCGGSVYNAYPIYDWRTEDLWTYHAKTALPHNELYDRMHLAGLTPHQMRICQPYGDDQRKGLWLYQIIEPETWSRVVARVNGANQGALYAQESGNINGTIKVSKPPGHTWQSFAELLLSSMPPGTADHYRNKIAVFVHWWEQRGYGLGIPDEGPAKEEQDRKTPSWRRICKSLLRNDYWCKGLSFTQTKSDSYERYLRVMKNRRLKWGF
jgi:predicted phosphoadenosine phosphosulfate sulfurtransferase